MLTVYNFYIFPRDIYTAYDICFKIVVYFIFMTPKCRFYQVLFVANNYVT